MSIMTRIKSLFREARTSYRQPAAWLVDWMTGGGSTPSGVHVNEESALKCAAVYACISAISSDIAKLPCWVYAHIKGGGKTKVWSHPANRYMNVQWNPLTTAFEGRRALTAHALSWGNGYALKERNGKGEIINMWVLRPDRVQPYRTGPSEITYFYQWYPTDGRDVQWIPYSQEDILHIPGLGFDGIVGYDVITMARGEHRGKPGRPEVRGVVLRQRGQAGRRT